MTAPDALLREALEVWAIPALTVYAEENSAIRVALKQIDKALAAATPATPPASDPDADDAECGCGAIGVGYHTNAQHYGTAQSFATPPASAPFDHPALGISELKKGVELRAPITPPASAERDR